MIRLKNTNLNQTSWVYHIRINSVCIIWLALFVFSLCEAANNPKTEGVIDLYKKYISPINGKSCSMHPSCSQYAKQAFKRHSAPYAFVLSSERLIRCGHDLASYEQTSQSNYLLALDTLGSEEQIQLVSRDLLLDSLLLGQPQSFSEELLIKGFFDQALVESIRFLYENPDSLRYLFTALKSMYFLNDSKQFEINFQATKVRSDIKNDSFYLRGLNSLMVRNKIRNHQYAAAKAMLNVYKEKELLDSEKYFLGISHIYTMDWANAEEFLFPVAPIYGLNINKVKNLQDSINSLPKKNPVLAGWASAILPGAGFAYAGKTGTGLAAFLVNGIFIWAAYDSFTDRNWGIFAGTILLESGWYFGTIRGSYQAAYKFNLSQINSFLYRVFN